MNLAARQAPPGRGATTQRTNAQDIHLENLENLERLGCEPWDALGMGSEHQVEAAGSTIAWRGLRYAVASRWEASGIESSGEQSEDCLAVNVWWPAGAMPNSSIVFIHGGSFEVGSIAPMYNGSFFYDGARLAAQQHVVVATMQYRLGALGWLGRAGGNLGLMDQTTALRFLRKLLGVGVSRTLLFGQSAGSMSVCAHLTAAGAGAETLFDAAAMMSGVCQAKPMSDAYEQADAFAQAAGCASRGRWSDSSLRCLRELSAGAVIDAQRRTRAPLRSSFLPWGPTVDGGNGTLPLNPATAAKRGELAKVPVIVGNTANESFWAFVYPGGIVSPDRPLGHLEYAAFVAAICASSLRLCRLSDTPRILRRYPCADNDCLPAFTRLFQDAFGDCSTARTARHLSAGLRAFAYEWRWRSSCASTAAFFPPSWGAYHTSDMPFVFEPFANCSRTPEGEALSSAWGSFLSGLLTRGLPDHRWPPVATYQPKRMVLGNYGEPAAEPWLSVANAPTADCGFWDELSWTL
ncbi:hypothetical protein EMIHUDRAFT_198450 [Emiliania huxleyi CCMP1516]|uniref:Carboxylesterase type B domain-containing protein n=2 Tax=Emiliania huxleyi TaxID=2903 RepID=A0A0D3I7A7_EMIH1|nr:hypothetical protein EMIHUDRAFT_198450 [Emiliania huxleyi CCMP1516]EOD07142.1 hypothetical protein EMIHUDRAFT_198450 [Emiliania huxleyi CCMP1516]|eukprot:XP_005759571.1 hypothetical protein EMIHUDRAFT_198450 [Emiliania huxleyi CCMP1516]